MARPKKPELPTSERIVEPATRPYVSVNRVTAGECSACVAWRVQLGRENRTEVYCTKGRLRYCKCGNCGNTWKVIDYSANGDGGL